MDKEKVNLDDLKLIGITVRTNNKNEMDPATSKIAKIAGVYWSQNIAGNVVNRKQPGVTYAAYTDFESDENGDYTYFIGEQVDSFAGLGNPDLNDCKQLTIPASSYQKFTTQSGKMPAVVIDAWQEIWRMQSSDFGGKRKYIADFEVYDQRASDPNNTIIDIYIGIE